VVALEPPAYALLRGTKVTMEIECSAACSGTGILNYPPRDTAAAASSGRLVTRFSFRLRAKGATAVTATLTPAGRKLMAKKQRLIVAATIVFKETGRRPLTYVSALDVTRTAPKPRSHTKGSRAGTPIRAVISLPR
jgi:hypothetical protein